MVAPVVAPVLAVATVVVVTVVLMHYARTKSQKAKHRKGQ
jgi:hypothetical protein